VEKLPFFIPIVHRAKSKWNSNEELFRLNIRILYMRIYVRVPQLALKCKDKEALQLTA